MKQVRLWRGLGVFVGIAAAACTEEVPPAPADTDEPVASVEQAMVTITLDSPSDTYVSELLAGVPHGSHTHLRVTPLLRHRALVHFSTAEIEQAWDGRETWALQSATLRLPIAQAGILWGPTGGQIGAYAMSVAWSEPASNWACRHDTIPGNLLPNCTGANAWSMGSAVPFDTTATGTATITNLQTAPTTIDVTGDVWAYMDSQLNGDGSVPFHGWAIKKVNETQLGAVDFASRESGAGPQLILVLQPPPCGPVDDGNPCTTDACTNGVETHTPRPGESCTNGEACDGEEVCSADGLTCLPGTPLPVDDENVCTTDQCSGGVVTHTPAPGTSCSDNDECNGGETCDTSGACAAGTPVVPEDDGNVCTLDVCVPADGSTGHVPQEGANCGDGDDCNGVETCGSEGQCLAGTPPNLDDGNACTVDSCDGGAVVHAPAEAGTACDNHTVCDGEETCDGARSCVAGTPPPLDDGNACTLDECDDALGPTHSVQNGAPCTDGSACNGQEACNAVAECVAGGPPILDDGNPATIDWCDDAAGGVVHTAVGELDPSRTTTMKGALSFLYESAPPLQAGMDGETIDEISAAGLEGYVYLPNGDPAVGALVRVIHHEEYGTTVTDVDGRYLLAINGGQRATLEVSAAGYLPSQRSLDVAWQTIGQVEPIVLVEPDGNETFIDLANLSEVAAAEGSIMTDEDGERLALALIAPGTTAHLKMPDGSLVETEELTLRLTEYTVGAQEGPRRMPGTLPMTTGYTYAIEVGSDEAIAAGATSVVLSEPARFFVDNFVGVPVGTVVPVGSYDRERGVWVPEVDGVVLAIVDEIDGLAEIDLDGDGVAEAEALLDVIGLDAEQREALATHYAVGSQLWYARLDHLTPFDCNLGFPKQPSKNPMLAQPDECPGEQEGNSRIECTSQVLIEDLDIAGTGHSIHYRSDRVPGASRSITSTRPRRSLASWSPMRARSAAGRWMPCTATTC